MTAAPRHPDVLVIGIGNRDRGDDGVGPAVIDELRRRSAPCATVVREGDLADLAVLWRGHDEVVLVDACQASEPVGAIATTEWLESGTTHGGPGWFDPAPAPGAGWSTHGIGVAEAIELARRLRRLPARLRLVGVVGRSFGPGSLSEAMVAALPHVVDEIEELVRAGPAPPVPGQSG